MKIRSWEDGKRRIGEAETRRPGDKEIRESDE